jgi:hypothetical protein
LGHITSQWSTSEDGAGVTCQVGRALLASAAMGPLLRSSRPALAFRTAADEPRACEPNAIDSVAQYGESHSSAARIDRDKVHSWVPVVPRVTSARTRFSLRPDTIRSSASAVQALARQSCWDARAAARRGGKAVQPGSGSSPGHGRKGALICISWKTRLFIRLPSIARAPRGGVLRLGRVRPRGFSGGLPLLLDSPDACVPVAALALLGSSAMGITKRPMLSPSGRKALS